MSKKDRIGTILTWAAIFALAILSRNLYEDGKLFAKGSNQLLNAAFIAAYIALLALTVVWRKKTMKGYLRQAGTAPTGGADRLGKLLSEKGYCAQTVQAAWDAVDAVRFEERDRAAKLLCSILQACANEDEVKAAITRFRED